MGTFLEGFIEILCCMSWSKLSYGVLEKESNNEFYNFVTAKIFFAKKKVLKSCAGVRSIFFNFGRHPNSATLHPKEI